MRRGAKRRPKKARKRPRRPARRAAPAAESEEAPPPPARATSRSSRRAPAPTTNGSAGVRPSEAPEAPEAVPAAFREGPAEEEDFAFEESDERIGTRAAAPSGAIDREVAVTGREVLEEMLEHMGIYADVNILEGADHAIILDITGQELGILIGRRGSTLAALQFIVNLILGKRFQYQSKVIVGVEGYRVHREKTLTDLAHRMADRVRGSGQMVTLEAMAPAERGIVHLALQDDPEVMTRSIGEGEGRKVTIQRRR